MPQDKIKLKQAVIVEGKYDKIRLESMIDALILPTHGFRIFTDGDMRRFIRGLAASRGIIVLTDSDTAGFKIRSYLGGMIPREQITHVYIPDVSGKERRKKTASAEGKLGVEGMESTALRKAFEAAGVMSETREAAHDPVTKLDLYEDGFVGGPCSRALRQALYKELSLPEHININAALPLVNAMLTKDEYNKMAAALKAGAFQSEK
ncbi:MAG: DUF4093 domain-containing protein [Oscillospiraceae bacterium]|jgi:ribonuclease M5|nr:DUF4093 domain-containing protein [Oscillospiraceae bacterium]